MITKVVAGCHSCLKKVDHGLSAVAAKISHGIIIPGLFIEVRLIKL